MSRDKLAAVLVEVQLLALFNGEEADHVLILSHEELSKDRVELHPGQG